LFHDRSVQHWTSPKCQSQTQLIAIVLSCLESNRCATHFTVRNLCQPRDKVGGRGVTCHESEPTNVTAVRNAKQCICDNETGAKCMQESWSCRRAAPDGVKTSTSWCCRLKTRSTAKPYIRATLPALWQATTEHLWQSSKKTRTHYPKKPQMPHPSAPGTKLRPNSWGSLRHCCLCI